MKSWLLPALVALAVLLYLRSPIDLIPDLVRPFGLLDDLAVLLSALWWYRRRRRGAAAGEAPRGDARDFDPYAVLGVDRDAGDEDIARAYRECMKRYHPDRVADLGDELRHLAHEKTVEIQRAYEQLRRGRRAAG